MNKQTTAGYAEVPHTADWELHVWASDLIELLVQAAKGMYTLADTRLLNDPKLERSFTLEFIDRETLVVRFLSELLFYGEVEKIAFESFQLDVENEMLHAHLRGAPIAHQAKEIKAVTYHRLEVRETQAGLEVNIVFDV